MKKALYFDKLENNKVQCKLCPHKCVVSEGNKGICGVRKNVKGELYSLVYGKAVAMNIDPIEKKPLFHFLPGEGVLSVGTYGCNLKCKHCQNFDISQVRDKDVEELPGYNLSPEEIVKEALKKDCKMIAYTYTEPTIFFEYMLDIAKLAKKNGLKNIIVSNGYINPEPLKELVKYIDAANIDLKAFAEEFYKDISCGSLKPVLETLKYLYSKKVWLEITTLLIPAENDYPQEIREECKWIKENLSSKVPIHFSRFFPLYKMIDKDATSEESLIEAKKIASEHLDYVYIGNILINDGENTHCPKCKKLLIERDRYFVLDFKEKCECGFKLDGVFE